MEHADSFFKFNISSRSFLSRSKEHLSIFEKENSIQHFFYSALELRFGIEARLNEYLRPALESIGKNKDDIPYFVATKLLKRLIAIAPESAEETTLRFTSEQTGNTTVFQFTPVSPRLAAIHGQLGELLHYKFFNNNHHWYFRKSLGGNPHRSIIDFVSLLQEGISELEFATSGLLLNNPQFTALVQSISSDTANAPSAEDRA